MIFLGINYITVFTFVPVLLGIILQYIEIMKNHMMHIIFFSICTSI